MDAGWDTVDPEKETAFGKRVTRPKPLYLRGVSYPHQLLQGGKGVGMYIQRYWKGDDFL